MIAHVHARPGRAVVLIPGLSSRRIWAPVVARWPDGLGAIVVDYPGFGESPPTQPPTPAAAAAAVIDLLDRLGQPRPLLVGHSLGGWVALEVARAGRAGGVLALAPAGLWSRRSPWTTDLQLNLGFVAARAPRALRRASLESRIGRRLSLAGQSARPADVEPDAALALADDAATSDGWLGLFRATRRERFTGGASIDGPVDVVFGDRDRIARPASRRRDELPAQADVVTWPGCGHALMWDAPDRIAEAVADLARRTE